MSGLFLPWDVDWESHPRFVALRRICGRADRFERAVCLYVSMCCWSKKHRTDGQVPSELHASPRQVEAKSWLTRAGLVDDLGTTCLILGFTERNATREEVEEKRGVWREKKRRQRSVSPGDTALRDRDRDRDRDTAAADGGDIWPAKAEPTPPPPDDDALRLEAVKLVCDAYQEVRGVALLPPGNHWDVGGRLLVWATGSDPDDWRAPLRAAAKNAARQITDARSWWRVFAAAPHDFVRRVA